MNISAKTRYVLSIAFVLCVGAVSKAHAIGWVLGKEYAALGTGLEDTRIKNIVRALMMWTLVLVGIVAVMAFAIAGILYLTAAGDENQTEKAKKIAVYAIVGIVIALSGVIVLKAINTALKGESTF